MDPQFLEKNEWGIESRVVITYSLCLRRLADTFAAALDLPPKCREALGLAAPFSAPCLEIIENYLRRNVAEPGLVFYPFRNLLETLPRFSLLEVHKKTKGD
jgi:hypothetical protein